jgi:hypothetical protein
MLATELIRETREALDEGLLTLVEANDRMTAALNVHQCKLCKRMKRDCPDNLQCDIPF